MIKTVNMIELGDWDTLVETTYGRPYCLQQQDGCKSRGVEKITVPTKYPYDYENESIPEVVNGDEMGVSFSAWLTRDPKLTLKDEKLDHNESWYVELFWHRNFYPSVEMIANDLYEKGLLPAGEYSINIDW